ncbi:MAG TPA: 23S rRNA (uracil(1939)-C(5))-methyltransferase RlmD [Ignavibacteria bacterium]|nr:23S rRNA (uracil(1939)-C(5))-methyltransferase RlmD [Ignavibacteria bacterium]
MKKGDLIDLLIEDLNSDGVGIGRTPENFVIFVPKSLPGDIIKSKITKIKSNYAEAKLIEIIEPSKGRIEPYCMHFGVCGGCKIQNFNYNGQLKFKENVLTDAFVRLASLPFIPENDCLKSPDTFFYRNKMEFSFSDDLWIENPELKTENNFALGLHVPGFHSKIVSVKFCYLQSELSNKILNFTRDFFEERNTSIYSTKTHSGYLRFLIIRQSVKNNELMVNLITENYDESLINEYKDSILFYIPEITTIVNSISTKKAQVAVGESEYVLYGDGIITESLATEEGKLINYQISPNSFFQTNSKQAENLYRIAVKFSDFDISDNVLDLYCGAGAISLFISGYVNKVTGVELVESSINDAFKNADLNGIENCHFIKSDIKDFLLSEKINDYNKVILDPPRAGLHPEICEILSETKLEKIVYISCNPSTQARDLKIICGKGNYKLGRVQPVDMFPHTYHVENVVELLPCQN